MVCLFLQVRVYTSLGKREHGRFGLVTAIRTLDYLTEYFGIGFPLKKCDLIGLQDFSIGKFELLYLIIRWLTVEQGFLA